MANPWLLDAPAEAPAEVPKPVTTAPLRATTGVAGPQRGVAVPDVIDRLATAQHGGTADLWCLGVHGGAGESTLAALVPGWRAAAHSWPKVPAGDTPAPLILVARSSAVGLRAAQNAARQWASGSVPPVELLGLVIVADAPGRLPRPLRDLAALVSGGVPRTWHLPWVESWRLGEDVALTTAPRPVRQVIDSITQLLPQARPGQR